jgi:hypothetical protein
MGCYRLLRIFQLDLTVHLIWQVFYMWDWLEYLCKLFQDFLHEPVESRLGELPKVVHLEIMGSTPGLAGISMQTLPRFPA